MFCLKGRHKTSKIQCSGTEQSSTEMYFSLSHSLAELYFLSYLHPCRYLLFCLFPLCPFLMPSIEVQIFAPETPLRALFLTCCSLSFFLTLTFSICALFNNLTFSNCILICNLYLHASINWKTNDNISSNIESNGQIT